MQDNVDKTKQLNQPDYHAKLEHLEKRIEELHKEGLIELKSFRRKFDRRFHLLYIFLAFTGVTLVWYGLWTIISDIPVISNPYVAGAMGLAILLLLGRFFDRLV